MPLTIKRIHIQKKNGKQQNKNSIIMFYSTTQSHQPVTHQFIHTHLNMSYNTAVTISD